MAVKFDYTIKSSSFRDGVVKASDGSALIDMRGDRRIDDIQNLARTAMDKNGWKLPENEKEVAEKVTELMHKKEFYGQYSDKSTAIQEKLASVQSKISEIELNKDNQDYQKRAGKSEKQFDKELESLKGQQEQVREKLADDLMGRNITNLKDVKSGETVCFHQAGIVAKVMDGLGSENDLCVGVMGGSVAISKHAFVQSREGKKNIIDPTNPHPYWHNLNSADIRDGEVVRASESEMGGPGMELLNFGGGKYPGLVQRIFPDKYLKEEIAENQPKTGEQAVKTVLEANMSRAEDAKLKFTLPKDVDKQVLDIMKSLDKGVFGCGTISGEEMEKGKGNLTGKQIEVLEKAGVSLSGDSSYKLPDAGVQKHRDHGAPNR